MGIARIPHRAIITSEKDPSQGSYQLGDSVRELIRNMKMNGSIKIEHRHGDKVKESESHLKI